VVIGTGVDEAAIRERLDEALVTDEEWAAFEEGDGEGGESLPFPTEQGEERALREP